jgi:hypothetical protein
MTDERHDARQQAAERDLDKLQRERDALGGLFARWFSPRNVEAGDPVELWGARIGRGLSAVAVTAICLYLIWVYFGQGRP